MTVPPVVVGTNVVVSAFLTREFSAPPVQILRAMLDAQVRFLLSVDLLAEYREVMLRPAIRKRDGLKPDEVDLILEQLVFNCVWWEAAPTQPGERAHHSRRSTSVLACHPV